MCQTCVNHVEDEIDKLQRQRKKFVTLRDGEFANRWGGKSQQEINKIDAQLQILEAKLDEVELVCAEGTHDAHG